MSDQGFTTEIRAEAGFDYRDDLQDQRGARGLTLRFMLHGPLGSITWDLLTGWMERPIDELGWSIASDHAPHRADRPGVDRTRAAHSWSPTAGPVACHAHEKRRDYWSGPFDCDVIGGQCYGDAGYTIGDEAFQALVAGGNDQLFAFLREIYDDWLGADDEPIGVAIVDKGWTGTPVDPEPESDGEFLARLGTDASIWADEFARKISNIDKGILIAWFANSIMAGHDEARRLYEVTTPCAYCDHSWYDHHLSMHGCGECPCTEFTLVPNLKPEPESEDPKVVREYDRLNQILGELAGFASLCWNPRPGDLVFDSDLAATGVERAVREVREYFASKEDAKTSVRQILTGRCHICGEAIETNENGIWKHANGPYADHGHGATKVRPLPPEGVPVRWKGHWWADNGGEWYSCQTASLDSVRWSDMIGARIAEAPDGA